MNIAVGKLKNAALIMVIASIGLMHQAKAQPQIMIEPVEFNFELSIGAHETDVLNVSNDGDETLFLEISQAEPDRDAELIIMIWTRFANVNPEVNNIISSLQSLPVEYSINRYSGEDPDEFTELLFESHVLVIPEPENASLNAIRDLSVDLEGSFREFLVQRAGYIVVLDYLGSGASFLSNADLMDIEIGELGSLIECETAEQHVLNADVRDYFALRGSNLHAIYDETAFSVTRSTQDRDLNHVSAKRFGRGGLVYIGSDWLQFNASMTKLLVNAIMWSRGGSSWLFFEQTVDSIAANDFADMIFMVNTNIIDEPGDYAIDIKLLTNDPENRSVTIPVSLIATEWLPPEIRLIPEDVFIVSDNNDTSFVVSVRNPGNGWLEADVELEDTEQNWLTINRNQISLGPGHRDRILLQFNPDDADPFVMVNNILFTYINVDTVEIRLPVHYYTDDRFGAVEGRIYDAEDRAGIEGVSVSLSGIVSESDDEGWFSFDRVPPFIYNAKITHTDFLTSVIGNVEVTEHRTTQFSVPMYYAALNMDIEKFVGISVPPESEVVLPFTFENPGSGDLEYTSRFKETTAIENIRPWQMLLSLSTAEITENNQIMGVEFIGDNLLVSATENDGVHTFYLINQNGEIVEEYEQPEGHPLGMAGLAWDGTLVYGTGYDQIIGFDLRGHIRIRIPSPIRYNRAVAWDKTNELIWVAYARNDIYALNMEGEIEYWIPNPDELQIYGLSWRDDDPLGYNLYLFCREGPHRAQILKANPETRDIRFVFNLSADGSERAGDIALTETFDPRRWSLVAQFDGGVSRTSIYNLDTRQNWAMLEPAAATIPAYSSLDVSLTFRSTALPLNTVLDGYLTIDGHQRGGIDTVMIRMIVSNNDVASEDGNSLLPDRISLSAYPNPFNQQLFLDYKTPSGSRVKLSLYDLRGRLVTTLIDERQDTNAATISLKADELASGIYLAVLKVDNERIVKKLALVR